MRRRASASITLVLIGTAAISGCGEDPPATARDLYRSRADCQVDWGEDARKCEAVSSGPHSGYWYGPHYNTARTTTDIARPGSRAMSTHVSRSGFGSSASAHGSSSS